MEQLSLLEKLIEPKTLKVLQAFFEDEDKEFYLIELSKRCGTPPATTFRIINKLTKMGVIDLIMVSKFKLYKVHKDKETDVLRSIIKKDKKILDLFVERMRELAGLKQVVLHGQEAKDKADVLLIGEDIDTAFVKSVAYEIKEKYNYNISWLPLAASQYEQMISMGLYNEEKRTLFLRKN